MTLRFALCLLRACEAIASAVDFFDVAVLLEFSDDSRKESAAVMLEAQSMSNFPDAFGLRLLGEIGDHLFGRNFGRKSLLFGFGRMTLVGAAHRGANRLTDLLLGSKGCVGHWETPEGENVVGERRLISRVLKQSRRRSNL